MKTIDRDYDNDETDRDTLSPGDLLDETGSVDVAAVKSLDAEVISRSTCDEWRREFADRDGVVARRFAEETDFVASTIREHVKGKCRHDNDEPPVEHDGYKWVSSGGDDA